MTRPPAPPAPLTARAARRWRAVLLSALLGALLALLAALILGMGAEILMSGANPWVGGGLVLAGLFVAALTLVLALGAWDLARLSDPVLDIGPEGVLDQRLSARRIAWADLDWDRVIIATPYGQTDQVRLRLHRPYPMRASAGLAQALGRVLPLAAFRGRPVFIAPLGADATTDRIAEAMARHRPPAGG